jgi:putative ABC transport system permease protein
VVVGVARDSAVGSIGEPPQPRIYRPLARQEPVGLTAILLETGSDSAALVPAVRRTLLAMEHGVRVYQVEPLRSYVDRSYADVGWMASALSVFGLLALVLATIGLYGVIAYRVSLLTKELGIRIALGATGNAIVRHVVGKGLTITVAGLLIGAIVARPANRILASVQPGVRPFAAPVLVLAALLYLAAALVACYVPASHASRVDPTEALLHE